jgi:hypothetical protein
MVPVTTFGRQARRRLACATNQAPDPQEMESTAER